MNGWSRLTLHNFLNPFKQATAGTSEPLALYLLLSSPSPGTSKSQPRFTAWLCLGISKISTSSSHLRLLYSSGRMAWGRTQAGADLGAASPRKSQNLLTQWTTTDHMGAPPSCPHLFTADPPQGQRVVVSDHSQSLQLIGLGKSLPLISQQQLKLNYKRRVYSDHTKGVP